MKTLTLGLVGNPNCGKSTLFNELTGARQKVGNWPGVTIECKTGCFLSQSQQINVVDLPGIYQLSHTNDSQAIDEKIACDFILANKADVIINIIDAAHLERHLYLTLQLLSMSVPIIVAVNMMDVAKRRQISVNLSALEKKLGCPVIGLVANKGKGINELKKQILTYQKRTPNRLLQYPDNMEKAVSQITQELKRSYPQYNFCEEWLSLQILQGNAEALVSCQHINALANTLRKEIEQTYDEEIDIILADIFYTSAHELTKNVLTQHKSAPTITERIDKIVLNRFLGIPIFLMTMYAMFLFAINIGGAFQDFFDISSDAIFVQGTTELLSHLHAPNWLIALLAAGFGRGINTTISFIPVIAAMFLFLALLEGSGYMARASFVIDRFMRTIGLPGKSFVPMIVGFGCNVPAILAARTLENRRDRILTVLMSPFMSCGARLAIFAVFTAAFFPSGGQNVVFALYMIGIVAAVLTGFVLRKTLLTGKLTPFVLELPAYHMPSLSTLLLQTWQRLNSFIFRAGKLIVPICMLIGVLNAINVDGTLNLKDSNSQSLLSSIGQVVTPVFEPMGIQAENWPATVGLVTGILAKEVVVATLNTLYTQDANIQNTDEQIPSVGASLKSAIISVPSNLAALKSSFANPIIASAPDHMLNNRVYGIMYERFNGPTAAFAYLLFVLLYFPCISATAVMAKELNKKWTLFSVAWSTGIAYGVATSFYQLATFTNHPKQSVIWLGVIVTTFACVLSIMRRYNQNNTTSEPSICC